VTSRGQWLKAQRQQYRGDHGMIYLDYNATTPVDVRANRAMGAWHRENFGNPSSRDHVRGWDASEAVESTRQVVAEFIKGVSKDINFTSSATESLNTGIKGFVTLQHWECKKIITCATEHDAVLAPCRQLQPVTGIEVEILPVNRLGHIDLDQLKTVLSSDKELLVALMAANNEIGTIHPVREISRIAHAAGALLLCDITQAVGKMPVDVRADGIDIAAFSAHKMYGPKGVGALFVRGGEPRINLEPLIVGGGQERGLRGGTVNVAGIVGFGEACNIANEEWKDEAERVGRLRDRLEQAFLAELPDIWINGDRENRIPNTSNIGFRGVDARTLIRDIHDIAVSTRSACSSGASGPSHVLKAIGLTDDEAYSCIRFSLGRFTPEDEIDYTIEKVIASVQKLRRSRNLVA
jgi:cysteine desulfurase